MTKKQFFQTLAAVLIVPGGLLAGMAILALATLLACGYAVFVLAGFLLAMIFDAPKLARRFWQDFWEGPAGKANSGPSADPRTAEEFLRHVEELRIARQRWLQ